MTTVTLDDVRTNLAELLRRVAAGENVVITDSGKWVAQLALPPDPPPTAEEIATRKAKAKEAVKDMVRWQVQKGARLPEDSPLRELFDEGEFPQ